MKHLLIVIQKLNDEIEKLIYDRLNNINEYVSHPIEYKEYCNIDDVGYILIKVDTPSKVNLSKFVDGVNEYKLTLLRKPIINLSEYMKRLLMTKYEKQKETIYKWRNKNKDVYLLHQHTYNKNKMLDDEYRLKNLERIKATKQLKQLKEGNIKKVGRPSKYALDDELNLICS